MAIGSLIFGIIVVIIVVYVILSCVRIVPQAQAYVIERLGAYNGTWNWILRSHPVRPSIPRCVPLWMRQRIHGVLR